MVKLDIDLMVKTRNDAMFGFLLKYMYTNNNLNEKKSIFW